ncbi:MAG TPA: hypothetical protein VF407_21715 [Polyangiaceae bacterium]
MSFDLHFMPCRFDGSTEKKLNPFTNETVDAPKNAPLTKDEAAAVVSVIERAGAKRDPDGTIVLHTSDGAAAEIYGKSMTSICMFAIRGAGVTPKLAQLLFDVLVAGNWVLLSDAAAITANAGALQGMPDDDTFDDIVIVTSADQVRTLLLEGWKAFEKYAAKVVS